MNEFMSYIHEYAIYGVINVQSIVAIVRLINFFIFLLATERICQLTKECIISIVYAKVKKGSKLFGRCSKFIPSKEVDID